MMDSKKSLAFKNIIYIVFSYGVTTIISFFSRSVFLSQLGAVNLGINSVFISYIAMLSIVDLGMDSVFAFSLYSPLRKNKFKKVKQNLNFFKKIYNVISLLILILGLISVFFLKIIIGANVTLTVQVYVVFILLVANTCLSYLLVYNKALIIADQRNYIVSNITTVIKIITTVFQILSLYMFKSFVIYTIILLLSTTINNVIMYYYAQRKYPHILNYKIVSKLEKSEKNNILKNIIGGFSNRLGTILVSSTDNIILANYVSIISVSMYANYVVIINMITTLLTTLSQGLTPMIGHVDPSNNSALKKIYKNANIIAFCLAILIVPTLLISLNIFIKIWLGSKYQLSFISECLIIINFGILIFRIPALVFIDAFGLQWIQKWKSLIEGLVNLTVGLFCVIYFKIGIEGVLLGTLFSNLFVVCWYEPFIVIRHRLHNISLSKFYFKFFGSWLLVLLISTTIYFIVSKVTLTNSIFDLIVKTSCSLVLSLLCCSYFLYKIEPDILNIVWSKIWNR